MEVGIFWVNFGFLLKSPSLYHTVSVHQTTFPQAHSSAVSFLFWCSFSVSLSLHQPDNASHFWLSLTPYSGVKCLHVSLFLFLLRLSSSATHELVCGLRAAPSPITDANQEGKRSTRRTDPCPCDKTFPLLCHFKLLCNSSKKWKISYLKKICYF